MELTQLRYFVEVARLEHVTKAARILNVAQPALTQAMHRLESELGVPLFVAKGRNIALSPYGAYFLEKVEPMLRNLDELPEHLRQMAKAENRTLHLNVLAASSLATDAVIEYQKIDDSLRIELKQNAQSDLYDVCVTTRLFYQLPPAGHDLLFVCTEKIYLAVPNIPRFQGVRSIALRDVRDLGFIALLGSRQLRQICDKYCMNAGIAPRIIFESDSPSAVRNMIAANMGIGFWPEFSWGKLDTEKVLLLEIADPVCSRDILITGRKNKQDNGAVERFYHFLTEYFRAAAEHRL
ncbi:MAG: LysR family transcriptional regulator [Treponemataceae bacterium]|nr:LysR family transcriptional regulator [Treponemataceae bacterium]